MRIEDASKLLGVRPSADEVRRHRAYKTKLSAAKKLLKAANTEVERIRAEMAIQQIDKAYEMILMAADSGFLGKLKPEVDSVGQQLIQEDPDFPIGGTPIPFVAEVPPADSEPAAESERGDVAEEDLSLPEPSIEHVEPLLESLDPVPAEQPPAEPQAEEPVVGEAEAVTSDIQAEEESETVETVEQLESIEQPEAVENTEPDKPVYEESSISDHEAAEAISTHQTRARYRPKKQPVNKPAIIAAAVCAFLLVGFFIALATS